MRTGNRESGRRRSGACAFALLAAILLLAGCSQESGDRSIGEGYIGANSPPLRDRLGPGSAVVTSLKPGDKVVILQKRRRWARVRVNGKQEGWIDERNIIAPDEFAKFQGVVQAVAGRVSQGQARARAPVNLHLEPDRKSPSFYQLDEGEACEVLEHRAVPKPLPPGAQPPVPQSPAKPQPGAGQPEQPGAKPAPAASAQSEPQPAGKQSRDKKRKALRKAREAGPPREDWFLVRGKGKAGWALARLVEMAIPDDVAQYAEGNAIVAWHVLDTVPDGDQKKAQYVWATSGEVGIPYDFTGIRVFIWNLNHHRYETSYRERNIRGVYPLTAGTVELKDGTHPSFTVVTEDEAGNKSVRQFVLIGNVVRRREQVQ